MILLMLPFILRTNFRMSIKSCILIETTVVENANSNLCKRMKVLSISKAFGFSISKSTSIGQEEWSILAFGFEFWIGVGVLKANVDEVGSESLGEFPELESCNDSGEVDGSCV